MNFKLCREIILPLNETNIQLKGYFKANQKQREQGYHARVDHLEKLNAWIRSLKDPLKGTA